MNTEIFKQRVTSTDELEALLGLPSELVIKKQLPELDHHMKSFISNSPFVLLGTVDSAGRCDVSPRGDLPSVSQVLDSRTLVIADRPGNRRADSLRNVIETGKAGLLFLIPGLGETLRVNGNACVMRDDEILSAMSIKGKKPVIGIGVDIKECYFQCAKALIRSRICNTEVERNSPSLDFAKILVDETDIDGQTVDSLKQQIEESYRDRLY